MKKLLLVLFVIGLIGILIVGCSPTVPAEGEGEGEGEGEVARVVLVEIFSALGCPYCEIVEPLLEQLAGEYTRDEMILVEERAWGLYSSDEISDRYEWYFPSSSDRGTPNILFNGLNQRIHGSSSYASIKSKIIAELGKEAKIKITVTRSGTSSSTTISGTIKNISSSTLDNLIINGMIYKDLGQTGIKYCLKDILIEQAVEVSSLDPGSSFNFSFTLPEIYWVINSIHGVIFVQDVDSSNKEILQAIYVD